MVGPSPVENRHSACLNALGGGLCGFASALLGEPRNHRNLPADMPSLDFVHLHVHSSYSLLEGALTIARLAELAKADKQAALALTDTDNMFGALEFSEKLSSAGIDRQSTRLNSSH